MERHNQGSARVIPVILRPAHWSAAPFSVLQALPRDGKPVTMWADRDEALEQVVAALSDTIKMMTGRSSGPSATQNLPRRPNTGDAFNDPLSGITFVWIPPGRFRMGDEGAPDTLLKFLFAQFVAGDGTGIDETPAHTVQITRGIWIGKYPVTQTEWHHVMGENPSYFRGNDKPVETVSWEDIKDYLTQLSSRTLQGRYRLPTEAEWEYSARSGSTDIHLGYSPHDIGWYQGNSGGQTHPVGLKAANAWGLHDVLGNVWEWCSDYYSADYYSKSLLS